MYRVKIRVFEAASLASRVSSSRLVVHIGVRCASGHDSCASEAVSRVVVSWVVFIEFGSVERVVVVYSNCFF